MIFGSVCSGIEAASVAWHPLGWRAAFVSEIEAFPRAVLRHHYPDVPLHGDFTTIEAGQYAAIDVLVGGTPCQSFSIAGLRGGLGDDRGNLALEYLRLAQRTRPKWLVWENVPGVLSSGGGRDFGAILGGMVELGYGFAYRVLDAQYIRVDGYARAVPQRRRRVFVVGYLGDWRRSAAVLFERESLSGHPAPRREAGQNPVPTLSARTQGGGGLGTDFECDGGLTVSHTLSAARGSSCAHDPTLETYLPVSMFLNAGGQSRIDAESETLLPVYGGGFDDVAPTLRAGGNSTGGDRPPGTDVDTCESLIPLCFSSKDHGADAASGVAPTLRAMGHAESHANAGGQLAVAFAENTRNELRLVDGDGGIAPALQTQGGKAGRGYPAIAFNAQQDPDVFDGHTGRLDTDGSTQAIFSRWRVRRLMPLECERLQGFPDGYTDVIHRGKPASDGPRYKALRNSMAVNVMRWIGQRIDLVESVVRSKGLAA